MLTGWVTTGDGTSAVNEATGYEKDHTFYCDETGARVEGAWVKDTSRAQMMTMLMQTSTGTT